MTSDFSDSPRIRQLTSSAPDISDDVAGRSEHRNWYCVHTKAAKEQRVVRYLSQSLGLEAIHPIVARRTSERESSVGKSFFPRYIFCRFSLAANYRAVRYAPDVIDVVQTGGKPIVVKDVWITALRSAIAAGPVTRARGAARPSGTSNPFADFVCSTPNQRDRVALLLASLQR